MDKVTSLHVKKRGFDSRTVQRYAKSNAAMVNMLHGADHRDSLQKKMGGTRSPLLSRAIHPDRVRWMDGSRLFSSVR